MSRGPKPIPGSTAASGLPQPPSNLTEAELLLWDEVIPNLATAVALSPVDSLALGDMIRCMARLGEAERLIDERGAVVDGYRGAKVRNPACAIAKQYRESLLWYSKQFGLDPRSRLRLPQPAKASPLDAARERLRKHATTTVQ